MTPQHAYGDSGVYRGSGTLLLAGQEHPRTHFLGHTITLGASQPIDLRDTYIVFENFWRESLRVGGVAIYPVAASGVAAEAELIMRTAALQTLSQYLFLTDDSGVGNAHAEPHIPCYHVERLDQAMIRMVANELSGQANQPDPEAIIRTVGNPVDGVCTGE